MLAIMNVLPKTKIVEKVTKEPLRTTRQLLLQNKAAKKDELEWCSMRKSLIPFPLLQNGFGGWWCSTDDVTVKQLEKGKKIKTTYQKGMESKQSI